ncbi:GntR family transcriptional regulator [Roseibium sp. RKSG952]|uniref:GntR family transcriptional regulator n=1 Tax=Roseibium sp. RKSG952 TaxID=2529384 RepID=UPI0012BB90EE|nr:GntR family transcriptional regulator [Roseibium sp. RKSG952]MTH95584.1 GntR family transcriptional regulator [Roseibium sp. RKSG952]
MRYGAPKYSLIVDQLTRQIEDGTYAAGTSLPTESQLMRAYSVSRHTVRSALQVLRTRGLITSRQGSGSIVAETVPAAPFVERMSSMEEFVLITRNSRRKVLGWSNIEVDAVLSQELGLQTGRHLIELRLLRQLKTAEEQTIAYVTCFMDALFQPVITSLEDQDLPVATLLEQRFGAGTGIVRQEVRAAALDADAARHLSQKPGDPALVIERHYAADSGTPAHLVTRSVCRADMVRVESVYRAAAAAAPPE